MLQELDGFVQSVRDCRKAYPNLTQLEFAAWYEEHFGERIERVLAVLKQIEPGGAA